MFGAFSDWLEQASEAVGQLSEQGIEAARQAGVGDLFSQLNTNLQGDPSEDAPTATQEKVPLALVTSSPGTWTATQEEWEFLVRAALSDERFCSLPAAATVARSERWKEVAALLSLSDAEGKQAVANAANPSYEPEADMAEWLPAQQVVYKTYAALVPNTISDESYWQTVGWKLALCSRCGDPDSLLRVVKMLAEGELSGEDASAPTHTTVDAEHWEKTEADLRLLQERLAWRKQFEETVQKELEQAKANLKLLRNLTTKQDVRSDLAESVAESCSYHKVKLAKMLGDAQQEQERLAGSPLSPEGPGDLYAVLLETNAGIQETLATFQARQRGGSTATSASAPLNLSRGTHDSCGADEEVAPPSPHDAKTTKGSAAGVDSPTKPTSPMSPMRAASQANFDVDEDTSFEPKLPWDDDDDI